MNYQEPVYEDVDESGETSAKAQQEMMKKALEPKTPLQVKLLAVSKAKRFANTAERTSWRKLEKKAAGSDPDSRLFYAWLEAAIEWGRKKNTPVVKMPYSKVISFAENEQAARNWIVANRSKVLRKKPAAEMKEVMQAKEKELDALLNEDE